MATILNEDSAYLRKWKKIVDAAGPGIPEITGDHNKAQVAILLENTERECGVQAINEASPANLTYTPDSDGNLNTGSLQGVAPVLISLVRRAVPNLIAFDLAGVQAMKSPVGLIFAYRPQYGSPSMPSSAATENDAFYREADARLSGNVFSAASIAANPLSTDPLAGFVGASAISSVTSTARYNTTTWDTIAPPGVSDYQGNILNEMSFTLDRVPVLAKERALKATYSIQMARDIKNLAGLDADGELVNMLQTEIVAEQNREFIRAIVGSAKMAFNTGYTINPGVYNCQTDATGRWAAERHKELAFNIERECNVIAKETRRGKGNWLLCTSDVATALAQAGIMHYPSGYKAPLEVDDTGVTFAGLLNGKIRVYIDPYATNSSTTEDRNYIVVGYKGKSPYDAGIFYAPYVPLELYRATNPDNLQPIMAFRTRYGMVANPFVFGANGAGSISANTNQYFRFGAVWNLG